MRLMYTFCYYTGYFFTSKDLQTLNGQTDLRMPQQRSKCQNLIPGEWDL